MDPFPSFRKLSTSDGFSDYAISMDSIPVDSPNCDRFSLDRWRVEEVLHLASSFNFPNFRKIDRSLDIVGMDSVGRRILEEKNVISNPRVI